MKRLTQIGLILFLAIIFNQIKAQTSPPTSFEAYELKASNITATTADLSWKDSSYVDIQIFEVLIYDVNTDTLVYKKVVQNTSKQHVDRLTLNTLYKWTVIKLVDTITTDLDKTTIENIPNSFKTSAYTYIGLGPDEPLSTDKIQIDGENIKTEISAYRMNANGMIYILINKDNTASILSIFNISGQQLFNETINGAGKISKEIDLGNHSKGIYFIRFNNKNFNKTIKISI